MENKNESVKNQSLNDLNVGEFYTNAISMSLSPFELEMQTQLLDSSNQLKAAVNIRMSLITAWSLMNMLEKQFKRYEELNGKINIPESILSSLK